MMDETQRLRRAASFGAKADAYERARPTYPDAAVDWLLPSDVRRVLDLGAGTGKLTRALVARGLEVAAVDPAAPMLDQLRAKLPGVTAHLGSAEAIPLGTASLDAVIVAQAWHWVDPARATAEVARVLVPGGTLGLLWNTRDVSIDWVARLDTIIDQGDPAPKSHAYEPIVGAPFSRAGHESFNWSYALDEPSLLDLVASRSFVITLPVAERAAMLEAVRALFHEIAAPGTATITLPYVTRCYRFRRDRHRGSA